MLQFEREYVFARFKHEMLRYLNVERHYAEDCGSETYGFTKEQSDLYIKICNEFEELINESEIKNEEDKIDIDDVDLPF